MVVSPLRNIHRCRMSSQAKNFVFLWKKLEISGAPSFFLSWTWIGTWLQYLPSRLQPLLLTATQGGETVAAAIIIPCRERRHGVLHVSQLHFNSTGDAELDCIMIEHNDFVGRSSPALWRSFLDWFIRNPLADELVVPGATSDGAGEMAGRLPLLHTCDRQASFATRLSSGGIDAILGGMSRNSRQQLRRALRALSASGELRCEAAGTRAAGQAGFEALKDLHIRSWTQRGRRHAFQRPFFESFHRALIDAGTDDGSVQLLRISAGSHVLGHLYNFRCGDHVFAYQSGFDGEYAAYKPGYVSHALAMEWSARRGATRYDFLAGDNRLKRTFATISYETVWHRFARRTPALRLEYAARSMARALRRHFDAAPAGASADQKIAKV
jgi:CelD/BcsL family acetyltransferase involved in cellulose biosynthesis